MIDMVTATLFRFNIIDPTYFTDKEGNHPDSINTLSPNYTNKQLPFGRHRVYLLNHSKVFTENGYVPHVTIRISPNRRYPYWLTIQWSPNKAVYGHNFYELGELQFNEMIIATVAMLRDCGISIHPIDLITCQKLARIDYGCNVPVTFLTANQIITSLNFFEKNARYQKDRKPYIKELRGSHIAFFNKSQYLIFYNKPAEILRVLEHENKSHTSHYLFALELREYLKFNSLEVLRIEHRLQNQTAIKRELEPLVGHPYPFTLKEVFNPAIREQILHKHIAQVIGKGSLETFVFGGYPQDESKQMMLEVRELLRLRQLKPVWHDYALTFNTLGEKPALDIIIEALPKTTGECGLKRWQRLIGVLELSHPLLQTRNEIYNYLSLPQFNIELRKLVGSRTPYDS
jgi:hypothetical protein